MKTKNKNWTILCLFCIELIVLQTVYFKLAGVQESVDLFRKIGLNDTGRIAIGILELVLCLLVLVQKTRLYASFSLILVFINALIFHFTLLGISVNNDGGVLFGMAWIGLICSGVVFQQSGGIKVLKNNITTLKF